MVLALIARCIFLLQCNLFELFYDRWVLKKRWVKLEAKENKQTNLPFCIKSKVFGCSFYTF